MSVYIYTFRTQNKLASLGGSPVKVYAFDYLCKMQDADNTWSDRPRARLLQANMNRAAELFAEHKPAFVAICNGTAKEWDGATVYAQPKGAVWYDCDKALGGVVGFLSQLPGQRAYANGAKGWEIKMERHAESLVIECGHRFKRRYIQTAKGGKIVETVKGYHCETNGAELTPETFEAWKAQNVPVYLANCQRAREEQAKREELAYLQRESLNCCAL